MSTENLALRSIKFAYLFGPRRFVARPEAALVHAAVCDHLGHDDIAFAYNASPESQGPARTFSARMERKTGRSVLQILLESGAPQMPLRLLMSYAWPASLEQVTETVDAVDKAVFSALEGHCQKLLAETRLRAACEAPGANGLGFLRDQMLRFEPDALDSAKAPLVSCSVKFTTADTEAPGGPVHELSLEPLRASPADLYLELVSKWTNASAVDAQKIDGKPAASSLTRQPSGYVGEAYSLLETRASSLAPKSPVKRKRRKEKTEVLAN